MKNGSGSVVFYVHIGKVMRRRVFWNFFITIYVTTFSVSTYMTK